MKFRQIGELAAAALLGMTFLTGCNRIPKNKVFSAEELPGSVIGVQKGTTGDSYARDLEENPDEGDPPAKVERFDKGADAIEQLKLGKIDCVLIDNEPAKVFVSENEDLQILPDIFANEDYAIAVKKDNTELKDKLNAAMSELMDEGVIDKILKNYIGDNTGTFRYQSPAGVDRSNGKLTMATNAEFQPYEYKENDQIVGIDVDMMQAICDKLGMELVIEDMDFDKVLTAVEEGRADVGVAAITVDDERLEIVDFTESYAKGVQVIITRKE